MSIGPQVINMNIQKVLAFPGRSVVNDVTEEQIGAVGGESTWYVNFIFKNLYSLGPNQNYDQIQMTFNSDINYWTIPLTPQPLQDILIDRSKWITIVKNDAVNNPVSPVMRDFNLTEFVIDNDSLRDVIKDLPFDIKIDTTPGGESSYMFWYDEDANIGIDASALYRAEVYMGGSGAILAVKPELITHRGSIQSYTAP